MLFELWFIENCAWKHRSFNFSGFLKTVKNAFSSLWEKMLIINDDIMFSSFTTWWRLLCSKFQIFETNIMNEFILFQLDKKMICFYARTSCWIMHVVNLAFELLPPGRSEYSTMLKTCKNGWFSVENVLKVCSCSMSQ